MKYKVLDSFKALTNRGEIELQPEQVIILPHDTAIRLLNEGKIIPIEKFAYKVYSELLETYLWIVETDQDMHSLRSQGISEAVYNASEIKNLKDISKYSLREIHKVKEVFHDAKVEDIKKA